MPRRYRKRKRSFRKRRARGMQRIRTYRYKSRNIGGDRARAKLFFASTFNGNIAVGQRSHSTTWCPNVGATPQSLFPGIFTILGNCPGLSTLATQFLRYRIRGIKIKYTIYPQKTDPATHEPVFFYVNAQAAGTSIQAIQRFQFQAGANTEHTTFIAKTEDNALKFIFGDQASHGGEFVFAANVTGNLSKRIS